MHEDKTLGDAAAQPGLSAAGEPSASIPIAGLPPLPEPWSAASTIKCTACGRPYKPVRPAFNAGILVGVSAGACECGNSTWQGVLHEGPSPAKYTADQMREYATKAWKAGYKHGAWGDANGGIDGARQEEG